MSEKKNETLIRVYRNVLVDKDGNILNEAHKNAQTSNSIISGFGAALVLAVFLGVCGLGPVLLYWWIAGAVTYD